MQGIDKKTFINDILLIQAGMDGWIYLPFQLQNTIYFSFSKCLCDQHLECCLTPHTVFSRGFFYFKYSVFMFMAHQPIIGISSLFDYRSQQHIGTISFAKSAEK